MCPQQKAPPVNSPQSKLEVSFTDTPRATEDNVIKSIKKKKKKKKKKLKKKKKKKKRRRRRRRRRRRKS